MAREVDISRLIDEAPLSGFQARIVVLCALASFLDGYDVQALGLAVPRMAETFGVAPTAFAPAPLALAELMKAGWASGPNLGFLIIPMLVCAGGVLLIPRALSIRPAS